MNSFIPNSVQVPNLYIDKYMGILTSDEWKVLSYSIRQAYGFLTENRITLDQLGQGTGLSEPICQSCLDSLVEQGLMIRLEENNTWINQSGVTWGIQLDQSEVNGNTLLSKWNLQNSRERDA